MPDWVLAVERAYVAAATGGAPPPAGPRSELPRALAAIGAIASRYLAVGTPRSLAVIANASARDDAALSIAAHRTWFAPRELRVATPDDDAAAAAGLADSLGARAVPLAEALAADIVCVHAPLALHAAQLRRGTHVNLLVTTAAIDEDLRRLATIVEEHPDLASVAAGLVDGRQLDELTVFVAHDAALACAALAGP
jgi:hypothetical protein